MYMKSVKYLRYKINIVNYENVDNGCYSRETSVVLAEDRLKKEIFT